MARIAVPARQTPNVPWMMQLTGEEPDLTFLAKTFTDSEIKV
jgi:hypothetical protein